MKPLGDMFIQAIKMVIAPIIFCTVVHGIAGMKDMKKVGRVGLKAIVYFEVVTTLALAVGLVIANLWQPGSGMNVDPAAIDAKSIQQYAVKAHEQDPVDYLTHIIPATVVGAFAEGEIMQVLFFAMLFASALSILGEPGQPLLRIIDLVGRTMFGMVAIIMRAAPIGAFGAMAFYHRQIRRGHIAVTRQSDGRRLCDLPHFHLCGTGRHRAAVRLRYC
jgi:aerobic C4-dicarboxylate transport protein